jgi:senataxin
LNVSITHKFVFIQVEMRSPSDLNERGTSSTSVSQYTGSLSSDIVVVSEVQCPSNKKEDVENITAIPAIPNKEDDKDIIAMPVIPDKDDVVGGITMLATPCAMLCNLATRCMRFFRS